MVYPSPASAEYCDWLLNVSEYNWSGPRLAIINSVYSAALASSSVSDNEWAMFNMITAFLWVRYQQWLSLVRVYNDYSLDWMAALPNTPSALVKNAVNDFFAGCTADGFASEVDVMWLFANDDTQNAVIPLFNPSFTAASLVNSPTFTQNKGYAGNGTNQYINTNWDPYNNGVKFTQNSASLFWYQNLAVTGYPIGSYNGSNSCFNTPGSANVNGSANFGATETNTAFQFYHRLRPNSASVVAYQNGVQTGISGQSSVAINTLDMYLLCFNNNGAPSNYSTGRISLAGFGSGKIPPNLLFNRISTLAATIGFNS